MPIAPIDLDAGTRHLDCIRTILMFSDKVRHATGLGRQRVSDAVDMLCIDGPQGKPHQVSGMFTVILEF